MNATPTDQAPVPRLRAAAGDRSWITRNLHYVFLVYLAMYPLPWLARPPSATAVLAFAIGVAAFLPLYFAGFRASTTGRLVGCALGILAVGFALQPFGGIWGVFAVYASAMLAYLRPTRRAAAAVALVCLAVAVFAAVLRLPVQDWVFTVFFGAVIGIASLASARLEAKNMELAASRDEARRLAVVAERERIARDLHDVLGHTLTVVAVKADLAGRLVERDPAGARAEIDEIRRTARTALADLRSAVAGMRSATLAAELAGAREALTSAGVEHAVDANSGPLPPAVETALAYVLRESVTNVVRHADARRCTIRLAREGTEARLEVRDDGRGAVRPDGAGISGMRLRLAPLGGRLEIEDGDGTRVLARVPLPEAAA